jgi:hypothetical protein
MGDPNVEASGVLPHPHPALSRQRERVLRAYAIILLQRERVPHANAISVDLPKLLVNASTGRLITVWGRIEEDR